MISIYKSIVFARTNPCSPRRTSIFAIGKRHREWSLLQRVPCRRNDIGWTTPTDQSGKRPWRQVVSLAANTLAGMVGLLSLVQSSWQLFHLPVQRARSTPPGMDNLRSSVPHFMPPRARDRGGDPTQKRRRSALFVSTSGRTTYIAAISASPNSEHFTSLAPSIMRAKS